MSDSFAELVSPQLSVPVSRSAEVVAAVNDGGVGKSFSNVENSQIPLDFAADDDE